MSKQNNITARLPVFENFATLINYAAKHYGESIAYTFDDGSGTQSLSYNQLKNDVASVISYLKNHKYVNEKIAIISSNRYEYIITFLAIVCSGNVVVPINKDVYRDELAVILNDCRPKAVFYSQEMAVSSDELVDVAGDSVLISIDKVELHTVLEDELQQSANYISDTHDSPCCIIYTSGTSGTPKGVMLSQYNILADAASLCRAMPMRGSVMLCLPLHHMYAWTASVLMPIVYGLEVIINYDSRYFGRDVKIFSPVNFIVVPAMMEFYYKRIQYLIKRSKDADYYLRLLSGNELLQKTLDERRVIFSNFTSDLGNNLRYAICGAAMVDKDMAAFFEKIGIMIYAAYGMTECSPVVSICQKESNRFGSVGLLLDCNAVRISDPDENGLGEICVKGENVMLGYYHREAETAAIYDGEWLRSGDLGYLDKDGFLYIKGRIKNLIIRSSGENISPEELELRILKIQHVDEVLVCDSNGLLVAKIFTNKNTEEVQRKIKEDIMQMNQSIPAYKRIDRVEFVDSPFERTSTNKIKRV